MWPAPAATVISRTLFLSQCAFLLSSRNRSVIHSFLYIPYIITIAEFCQPKIRTKNIITYLPPYVTTRFLTCGRIGLNTAEFLNLIRLIPSDDESFPGVSGEENPDYISSAISQGYHIPLFFCSLRLLENIFSLASLDRLSALLFCAVVANSVSLILLSILIFRLSRSTLCVLTGIALFAASPWPANYLFNARSNNNQP